MRKILPFVSEEDGIVVAYLCVFYVCTFECMYLDSTAAPPAIFLYNKLVLRRLDSTRFVDSTRLDSTLVVVVVSLDSQTANDLWWSSRPFLLVTEATYMNDTRNVTTSGSR